MQQDKKVERAFAPVATDLHETKLPKWQKVPIASIGVTYLARSAAGSRKARLLEGPLPDQGLQEEP